MAYLDLSQTTLDTAAATASFTPCEWIVVDLARHDSHASLFAPSRMRRFAERLFGSRRANPLADPRLETLRRMSVLVRRGLARLSPDEIARFLASGFSQGQLAMLAQHVTRGAR